MPFGSHTVIVSLGISAGSPFTQGTIPYIQATGANPLLGDSILRRVVVGAVEAIVVGATDPSSVAAETFRTTGGIISEGAGDDSVVVGRAATATGARGIAVGLSATSAGGGNIAIGGNAVITGGSAIVIGDGANTNGSTGIVIGKGSSINAGGSSSGIVIGEGTTMTLAPVLTAIFIGHGIAGSGQAVVIGTGASSSGTQGTVVVGIGASGEDASVAIGKGAAATVNSVVIGLNATQVTGTDSVVIGASTTSTGTTSVIVGSGGSSTHGQVVAFGQGFVSFGANMAVIGAPGTDVQTVVIGKGDTAVSPQARTLRFTDGSGANNAAGTVTVVAPRSTGNATPAKIQFQIGTVGASSSTKQVATTQMVIDDGFVTISNRVRLGNGTAALPSISFTSSTNTGIYRVGAGILGLTAGGVLVFSASSTSLSTNAPLLLQDGTTGGPALSFGNSPTTGVYLSSPDVLTVAVAGVDVIFVSSTGMQASIPVLAQTGLLVDTTLALTDDGSNNNPSGTATLGAGGTVTVSNITVTADSKIFLTPQNASGTAGSVSVSARVNGTSFTISSTNILDTRTVAWMIVQKTL